MTDNLEYKNIKIDNESSFRAHLKRGINLFTGAGFSRLPDDCGNKLPDGTELASEIIKKYGLRDLDEDLGTVADLVPEESLQNYIKERFTVKSCNELYYNINKLNLRSFITTNYDNVPNIIFSRNNRQKLYNAPSKGGQKKPTEGEFDKKFLIPFIPLHGNVLTDENIIVGSLNVALAEEYAQAAFRDAKDHIEECPTLFWGYRLKDSPVYKIISNVVKKKPHNIWILIYEQEDKKTIDKYRKLGCNVILGDTQSLLEWIRDEVQEEIDSELYGNLIDDSYLRHYKVPSKIVESIETENFFTMGATSWTQILAGIPFERRIVNKISDSALTSNVIIIGLPFTGKTTILMQVAKMLPEDNKFFFDGMTLENIALLIARANGQRVWVFIDNCTNLRVLDEISMAPNITFIATIGQQIFDSEKQILRFINYASFSVNEIEDKVEAEKIFETVPIKLRKNRTRFLYKDSEEERYSLIELITQNVIGALSRNMIETILRRVHERDHTALEILLLTVYLSSRGSALSTDVLMAYFGLTNLTDIEKTISKVNGLLNDLDSHAPSIELDNMDQDYYVLRSRLFLVRAVEVLEYRRPNDLKSSYASVVENFVYSVSPSRVWNYEDFKRREYDSELFFVLFGDKADKLYEYLYAYSRNPFVLQQWALYHRRVGRLKDAFIEIDKVLSMLPRNPSIQNSHAMIMFESSRHDEDIGATDRMIKAMTMMEKLHSEDIRKNYTTTKYAEYSIIFADEKKDCRYVAQAIAWIDELGPSYEWKKLQALREKLCTFQQ